MWKGATPRSADCGGELLCRFESGNRMNPLDDACGWDFLDYSLIENEEGDDSLSFPLSWPNDGIGGGEIDFSVRREGEERGGRKRICYDSSSKQTSKAFRERLRREKLNDRFVELSSVLDAGRPSKASKPAMLDDAIRVLSQLRHEAQDLKETNQKLQEEIKALKDEKNELRAEKSRLKKEKETIEQRLKSMEGILPLPAHPASYQVSNKMAVFPGYGMIPMYQYLSPAFSDTTLDHEHRPPAA